MKKAILIALSIAAALPALAQISKGNFMIGGSAGGSWSRSETNLSTSFPSTDWQVTVSPNLSYFVTKGLAVGAVTSYNTGRSWTNSPLTLPDGTRYRYDNRYHSFMLGPSIHYYLMLDEKFALFAQTSLAWGRFVSNSSFPETGSGGIVSITDRSYTNRSRAFSIGPGLAYFLNPHVGLLGGVTYRNDRTREEEGAVYSGTAHSTNGVYLNLGVQVFLGQ